MTRDEVTKKRIAEAGPLYRQIMVRAYAGEASPRQAIKAFCLYCTGEDRKAIAQCSSYSCPLWLYRGYMERQR